MARKRKPKSSWYHDSYIGKEIERVVLDKTRTAFWHSDSTEDPYSNLTATELAMAEAEYENSNIHFFRTKAEMRDSMGDSFWEHHSIDEYWSQYLYRDRLLANRQYGEARSNIFKENYIRAIRQTYGGNEIADRIVRNLRNLSSDEFYAITHMEVDKQFWKKDKNGNLIPVYQSGLPDISTYYPMEGIEADQVLTDSEETLIGNFERLGLEYDMSEYTEAPRETFTVSPEDDVTEKLKKLRRASRRKKRGRHNGYSGGAYNIYRTMSDSDRVINAHRSARDIQDFYVRSHPEKVKRAKDGHYYMPFVDNRVVKSAMRKDKSFSTKVKGRIG